MTAAQRKLYTLPILIFVIGVGVSSALLAYLIQLKQEKIARDFSRVAGDRSAVVAQRLLSNFSIPENVRQLFDASDHVDEKEFTTFVAPLLERTRELDSIAWVKEQTDSAGKTNYAIVYFEPQTGSDIGRGTLLNTLPGLDEAIRGSIKSNVSRWVHLPSTKRAGEFQSDWFIVLPVKGHLLGEDATGAKRFSESGVLLARVDLYQLMYEAFDTLEKIGMDAAIYRDAFDEKHLLARWLSLTRTKPYNPAKEREALRYNVTRTLQMGGKDWIICCRPAPFFLNRYHWWEEGLIYSGCLFITALIATYLLRQRASESELRHQNATILLLENVAVAANEASSDEELFRHSLRLICDFLKWPFGHVYISDEQQPGVLVSSGIFVSRNEEQFAAMREATAEMEFSPGEGMPGRVSLLAKPFFIPDIKKFADFRRTKVATEAGICPCFAFPVFVRGKVAAVLEFFDTHHNESFAGWEDLLASMGTQMSYAMERRLVSEEIREKNAVLENAAEGIAHVDLTGKYLSVNKAYAQICRVNAEELLGTDGKALVHPEDADLYRIAVERMLAEGRAEGTGRRFRPDGSIYFQDFTMVLDADRRGVPRSFYVFSRDVTEREHQQKALRDSEERFMAFMANNPASASIKDEDGRIVFMNRACGELFGFDEKAVVGKTTEEIIQDPAAAKISRDADRELLRTNQQVQLVETLPGKNGQMVHAMVYKFPMKGPLGKRLIGVLCLDITERMEAEKAIIIARDEALKSARLKSQFLANMSHEIRTPMNGLIGMLGLLGRTTLQPRQMELLQTATSASDSLLRLLNDILDFSKIEAGKLEIDPIVFDLRQCIRHAAKILAEPARKKGLLLTYQIEEDVPQYLFGDSGRLAQIVVNLLNNAVKFTKQGLISASVQVENRSGNSIVLHCAIQDTGIGISPEHRQLIFEPFRQSDSSTARQYGGTGLGLAICYQLVELMDGKIWLESEPGAGSTFHFTLRMEISQQAPPPSLSSQPLGPKAARPLRILLAEDNDINQQLAVTLLEERGHQVELASDGYQAVALFETSSFDLILMDVQMPGKDGYQATIEIRSHPLGETVPIYALTAHAMPEDRRRCMDAGMNDYLTKPIRVEEFARVVESRAYENLAETRNAANAANGAATVIAETAAPAPDPTGERSRPAPSSFDLPALRRLVNNNEGLILRLADSFAKQGAEDREKIRLGLETRNAALVETSAHRMKGSALSLSANSLASASEAVECAAREQDLERASQIWRTFDAAFTTLSEELGELKNN